MKKRLLASILSLVMLLSLLPTAALAVNESGTDSEELITCTMDANCQAETHEEGCPAAAPVKTDEGPTAEEQLTELIAALPDPEDIDPLDEAQVEEVNALISAIYAFAEENGLDVEDNETINAVIAALYPAEPLAEKKTINTDTTWNDATTLSEDLTVNSGVTLTIGAQVTISGNVTISGGGTIKRGQDYGGALITVPTDAKLTLQNITIDGGAVWSGDTNKVLERDTTNSGITATSPLIECSGNLTAENSIFQNNHNSSTSGSTGAISIPHNSSDTNSDDDDNYSLLLKTCTIKGNTGGSFGGGIYLGKLSTAALVGVTIYGNYGKDGGGIFSHGTITMEAIDVHHNYSEVQGGAFRGATGVKATFQSGSMHHNTSNKKGGAVYLYGEKKGDSTFTLEDVSTITENCTSDGDGGGIYLDANSVLTMTGGEITNNTGKEGGAIRVAGTASFTMKDGRISGNKAENGAAVRGYTTDIVLEGGEITNNIASAYGGAFYSNGDNTHSLILNGTKISENTAGVYGNNIFISISRQGESEQTWHYHCIDVKVGPNAEKVYISSGTSHKENDSVVIDPAGIGAIKALTISALENSDVSLAEKTKLVYYEGATGKTAIVPYVASNSDDGSDAVRFVFADLNGGIVSENSTFETNTLPTLTKAGAIFDGWYTDSDFSGSAVNSVTDGEKTYYAKWIGLTSADISMEYGGSQATPTIEGVSLNNWTSANTSIIQIEGGQLKAVGVGSTTITADASPAISRSGEKLTVNVTVTAKSVSVSMENKTETYDGSAKTIEATADGNGTLPEDLELVYSYKDSSAADSTYTHTPPTHPGTYTVKVESGNPNYTLTGSTTATLTISAPQGQEDVSGNIAVTDPSTLVYDGAAKTYTATYEGISTWSIVYYDSDGEELSSAPVNAGDYTVTINGSGDDVYASVTKEFTITPAALTITPNNKTAYVGDALPTLGENDYTVNGLVGSDTLTKAPTLAYASTPDMSTAGTYTIKASDAEAGDNYTITYEDGTLTVSRRSSGGGGGSSSSNNTTTETTKNPDGSTTTTTTDKKTGTVTETTKFKDGSSLVVETKKDGTVTTTDTAANGVKVRTVDEPGEDVTATVTIPRSVGEATVTIPADVDYGMVAMDAKTGEIIKLSVPTEDGMLVKLDGSADLVLVDNAKDFTDTQGHWAEDAIDFATAHEMFSGTSKTTFTPDSPMTRAMLMTVLARFDGEDTNGGSVWYEKGMAWAIANGVSDGSNPNGSITREQFATMLWRYAGSPVVEGDVRNFRDEASISGYAVDAMRWAVSNGIISGMGNSTLAPQNNATRAQVASMLMRFVESVTK